MIFNSIAFLLFFGVVFIVYWLLSNKPVRYQNIFLLAASFFFYGYYNWRFLFLLIAQIHFSYYVAEKISKATTKQAARYWYYTGVLFVLLILGFYKYFNFFSESFTELLNLLGFKVSPFLLKVALPLGISFYSFKIIAYITDVYRNNLTAENNFIDYSLYISFFPQVIAGPIERVQTLLPQIKRYRVFNYQQAVAGLKLILWGMFKKVVVADNCAVYVSDIFSAPALYNSPTLLIGMLYFALQVYADFSGYSEMVMGFGNLLGFNLVKNFDYPFSSKNITEFWRRWHISLGSWFNDYVFTPLYTQLRNYGNKALYVSILITFLLSGLWHGADWHFVFFGFLHGVAIAIETALKKQRKSWAKKIEKKFYNTISVLLTLIYLLLTWVYFRADSLTIANQYLAGVFTGTFLEMPQKLLYLPVAAFMLFWEYWQQKTEHPIALTTWPKIIRWLFYISLLFIIIYYFGQEQAFYYFQF